MQLESRVKGKKKTSIKKLCLYTFSSLGYNPTKSGTCAPEGHRDLARLRACVRLLSLGRSRRRRNADFSRREKVNFSFLSLYRIKFEDRSLQIHGISSNCIKNGEQHTFFCRLQVIDKSPSLNVTNMFILQINLYDVFYES